MTTIPKRRHLDRGSVRVEECGDCDGCGWTEGGKCLQTRCSTCSGEGVLRLLSIPKPTKRPRKPRTRLKRGPAPRRRSRPRRQRRGDVAALIRQADELFRRIVAGRAARCWNCWVHRAVKPLETAHHITRDAKAVRWNLANASPLCADCHRYFTREKALWALTWRDWIGGPAADEVERLAREGCRLTVPYMEAIVAGLKACV